MEEEAAGDDGGETAAEEGVTEEDSGEIVEIVWQYPSPGSLGVGFQDVEDAINEKMEADIGVHVTFEPVELMESQQKALLMITSGEQLDIVLSAFTSIGPLVSSNSIIPLTDLAEKYGQDMVADGIELSKGYYNGELYGIPPIESKGRAYGYVLKTEYLDKYNIKVDENKYYTLDDLDEIFEVIKAGEGENFYCCIPANMTPEPANNGYVEYDKIGGSLADGVIMLNKGFDNLTVTDLFETEEYRAYAEKMYEWAQKGYIAADAAVTTETNDTLIPSDHYLGNFFWGEDFERAIYENTSKTPMTTLKMIDGYYAIRRFAAYPNIWWNLANEYEVSGAKTLEDWHELESYIAEHDPWNHLLSCHNIGNLYDPSRENITHISAQTKLFTRIDTWRKRYRKPVIIDECLYEGNLKELWGCISGREMVRRFWRTVISGGYCTHGETFYDSEDIIWWAKGGILKGESTERIRFCREIIEHLPGHIHRECGVEDKMLGLVGKSVEEIDEIVQEKQNGDDVERAAQRNILRSFGSLGEEAILLASEDYEYKGCIADKCFLHYHNFRTPAKDEFNLPDDKQYRIRVIDTWEMTDTVVKEGVSGKTMIDLPGREDMLVLAEQISAKKQN